MNDFYVRKLDKQYNVGTRILPKAFFAIMAVSGCCIIWTLKIMGAYTFITTAIPVVLIITYCGIAWKAPLFYIREDIIGDNAYYLGFLYTLSSLAYALWHFQTNQSSDPADIIGSFGVALWSTICGIALRVSFSQLRQDPNDIEKEARIKVAQMASLLSSDLYQASVTFNNYTRGLQQSVDEAFIKAKEVSDSTIKAIQEVNEKISKVESPDSLINKKIDAIFSDLESATNRLNNLASNQTKSVESLIGSSSTLVDNINNLNAQVKSMQESSGIINTGREDIQKIGTVINSLERDLLQLSGGLKELQIRNAETVAGITRHSQELEMQLTKSRQYTQETHESLASMTKTLAEKLQ